mmetsp:Transcript_28181/g.81180  ORF Transcript_28181/g.81180 Transcript_28181/m.81180 type:complete len:147 (+) Transcript_28181:176-616(+)
MWMWIFNSCCGSGEQMQSSGDSQIQSGRTSGPVELAVFEDDYPRTYRFFQFAYDDGARTPPMGLSMPPSTPFATLGDVKDFIFNNYGRWTSRAEVVLLDCDGDDTQRIVDVYPGRGEREEDPFVVRMKGRMPQRRKDPSDTMSELQ